MTGNVSSFYFLLCKSGGFQSLVPLQCVESLFFKTVLQLVCSTMLFSLQSLTVHLVNTYWPMTWYFELEVLQWNKNSLPVHSVFHLLFIFYTQIESFHLTQMLKSGKKMMCLQIQCWKKSCFHKTFFAWFSFSHSFWCNTQQFSLWLMSTG